jgi:hypothetical protein
MRCGPATTGRSAAAASTTSLSVTVVTVIRLIPSWYRLLSPGAVAGRESRTRPASADHAAQVCGKRGPRVLTCGRPPSRGVGGGAGIGRGCLRSRQTLMMHAPWRGSAWMCRLIRKAAPARPHMA